MPGFILQRGVGAPGARDLTSTSLCCRAEPVLSRIRENRKRVILPSIDNIKQDTFEVQRYENSAHGYSWELWCMYISPPKDWWDAGDPSLPIRSVARQAVASPDPRDTGAPRGRESRRDQQCTKAGLGLEGVLPAWFSRWGKMLPFASLAQVFKGRSSHSSMEGLK